MFDATVPRIKNIVKYVGNAEITDGEALKIIGEITRNGMPAYEFDALVASNKREQRKILHFGLISEVMSAYEEKLCLAR